MKINPLLLASLASLGLVACGDDVNKTTVDAKPQTDANTTPDAFVQPAAQKSAVASRWRSGESAGSDGSSVVRLPTRCSSTNVARSPCVLNSSTALIGSIESNRLNETGWIGFRFRRLSCRAQVRPYGRARPAWADRMDGGGPGLRKFYAIRYN